MNKDTLQRQSMTAYGQPLEATSGDLPVPAGHEVLIKISHCGVCHSDLHIQDGYFNLGDDKKLDVTGGRELPFTLGHEIAGHVVATGPDATLAPGGTTVAVYPWIGCGTCQRCRAGDEHLCHKQYHLGINVDGGFASHVLVPNERYVLDISGIAPGLAGAYMCSGITAFGALKKALPYITDGKVMITGLGGVGMMALELAKALGLTGIYGADIDPAKRAAAEKAGALATFDPADKDVRRQVFKATGGIGAAIDFVGAESSLDFCQQIVAKAGAVVVVGLLGGRFSLPVPMFPLRQLAILGSFVASLNDARELLELARSGKLPAIPLAERPMGEANSALDDLRAGRVIGRVVLVP